MSFEKQCGMSVHKGATFFYLLFICIINSIGSYTASHRKLSADGIKFTRIYNDKEGNQSKEDTKPSITESPTEARRPRRIRYSGSYPKQFALKYKEARGDSGVIQKVLEKGGTPAGTHVPIMLKEVLQQMGLKSDDDVTEAKEGMVTVDCTLGYGGHTKEILECTLPKGGRHFAVDQDPLEMSKTSSRIATLLTSSGGNQTYGDDYIKRIHYLNQNFRDVEESLNKLGVVGKVDALLADLGYSSMQIDDPTRGFTYKADGPLDMRMDPSKGETALEFLDRISRDELATILEENSDESMSLDIAAALKSTPVPKTTVELATRVRDTCKKTTAKLRSPVMTKEELDSAVARTMQAIRIEVNGEFKALEQLLDSLPRIMAPGGRIAFLTFHSGEDRRVKKALKAGFKSGVYSSWSRDVVRASGTERRNNPRSKCAKLR
jgi:16S rRNA (cytosine1402-N4)-methyltransferase